MLVLLTATAALAEQSKGESNWDNSDAIAIASAFVAACALGVSLFQGYVTWDHNKRSVLPLLHIDMDSRDGHDIDLTVMNVGIGPAIITSLVIQHRDKTYCDPSINDLRSLLKSMGADLKKNPCSADVPLKGRALGVQQSLSVLRFDGSASDQVYHASVVSALEQFRVTISYNSIYGFSQVAACSGRINFEQNLPSEVQRTLDA